MPIPENAIQLKDVPLLQGLSPRDLRLLKKYLREQTYAKGDILFMEGDACERIFIVRSGRIKVFRVGSSGREQILEILNPGDTCACNPGSVTWSCSTTAQAAVSSKVWFFSRNFYVEMVNSNSKLSHTLNRLFAQRICHLSTLIEEVSLTDTQKRLVKFLLDIHKEGSSADKKGRDVLWIPFTREEIAQRIGTARETVARHLHQLKRSRLIEIKPKEIIIRDKEGLEKLLL